MTTTASSTRDAKAVGRTTDGDKNSIVEQIVKETVQLLIEPLQQLIRDDERIVINKQQVTHRLLIFIDELDRCRPTFAIETLEVVKHFFNVPNVVFVFSLDMNQLQKSIKTIYGDI